jgi:hypothetical protein
MVTNGKDKKGEQVHTVSVSLRAPARLTTIANRFLGSGSSLTSGYAGV